MTGRLRPHRLPDVSIGGIQKVSLVDYPGHVATALFTVGCNMRCGYCHNPELVLPERYASALDLEEVYDFLERRRGQLEAVVISGGEPTMHGDLIELAEYIKELGYKLKLDSNGTHPDMLADMIDRGLADFIAMDIKGPLEKYSIIAARPIDIRAIQRSIDLIMNSGISYEFRTTIVKSQLSPEDIDKIGQLINGAERFALQKFVPTKTLNPQLSRQVPYTDEEMEDLRQIMNPYVKTCVIH